MDTKLCVSFALGGAIGLGTALLISNNRSTLGDFVDSLFRGTSTAKTSIKAASGSQECSPSADPAGDAPLGLCDFAESKLSLLKHMRAERA